MLIDGKTERNIGKIPHRQLVEWARAVDGVVPKETDQQKKDSLRELQRHLWAVIQSSSA